MNWLIEAMFTGQSEFIGGHIGLVRVGLAIALLVKFSVESWRGHQRYLDQGHYLAVKYEAARPGGAFVRGAIWRLLTLFRWPAAFMLLAGVNSKPALLVLVMGLAMELRFFFKYHANFMLLQCFSLLCSRSIDRAYSVATYYDSSGWDEFVAVSAESTELIIVPVSLYFTLVALYFFAALHKVQPGFLSGRVVATTLFVLSLERPRRRHFDVWVPGLILEQCVDVDGRPTPLLRWAMILIIAIQMAIPATSVFAQLLPVTVVLGVLMHAMTTLFLPSTLLDFSVASLATYFVLVPPGVSGP